MARYITKHSSLNHSFNSENTILSTSPGQPGPGNYKTPQEWFTKTFEELAPTATVYTAPTYTAPNPGTRPGRPRPRNSETSPLPTPTRPLIAQILEVTETPRVGDTVWHLNKRQIPGKSTKTTHYWTGIFRVEEILQNGQIKIDKIQQPGHPVMTTIHRIRQYHPAETRITRQPRPTTAPPPPPA